MPEPALTYFRQLKQDIARTLRQSHPHLDGDIRDWKGEEIRRFQDDLENKVSGRISEKWFYTHIKSEQAQLPRIDILNLLSQYVGYASWQEYQHRRSQPKPATLASNRRLTFSLGTGLVLLVVGLLGLYVQSRQPADYQFCFVNADTRETVAGAGITVLLLPEGESPYRVAVDELGCVTIRWRPERVRLVVQGAYYQTDTIVRVLNKDDPAEQVALRTNDYAWLLRIFSRADVTDWQQRREQMNQMFTDNARIYQLTDGSPGEQPLGMELYNKQEFINKMTMPLRSLRNIEVLSTRYRRGRIQELRFKQLPDERPD